MSNTSFAELQEALEAIQKAVDLVWNFRLHDAEQVLLPFVCHVPMAALHFAEVRTGASHGCRARAERA